MIEDTTQSALSSDLDDETSKLIAELEAQISAPLANEGGVSTLQGLEEVPGALVAYVESICRSPWIVRQVLEAASFKVLRRVRQNTGASRRARWAKRWLPENRDATRRWLGQVRDRVVRLIHQGQVAEHAPLMLLAAQPRVVGGALVIDAPTSGASSFGSSAYLEQTPVEVIQWAHHAWKLEQTRRGIDLLCTAGPQVWDLTSGSGTVSDYFASVEHSVVVASDNNAVRSTGVVQADCRAVGTLTQHRGGEKLALFPPDTIVTHPDLVFFDPPSRGRPTHSGLYDGAHPNRDLALLTREEWLRAVTYTATRAVRNLAQGGFVSLVLRCGSRTHGAVQADDDALDDLLEMLGDCVSVATVVPLVFYGSVNQASLGSNRVPAVHVMLEAPR